MKEIDYGNDQDIQRVLDVQRAMSAAPDANTVVHEFLSRFHALAGVAFYAAVLVDGFEPGEYKLITTRKLDDPSEFESVRNVMNDLGDAANKPIQRGGFLGTMIGSGQPKAVVGVKVENDPVLGDAIKHLGMALSVPVFRDGRVHTWVVMFREDSSTLPDDARVAIVNANLMSRGIDYLAAVGEAERANEQLNKQLFEVAQVQQSLLPTRRPSIPGYEIATSYLTSDDAGGDYYDFFEHPDGRWGIIIADVSGHGAGAATVMAMLHAILHSYNGSEVQPDDVIRRANSHLTRHLRDGTFVTAFYGLLDPKTGEMTYSSSGHNPPRVKPGRLAGDIRSLSLAGAPPLGLLDDVEPSIDRMVFGEEDTLVLYTDGITEAFDSERNMFGVDGLDESLKYCAGEPDCVIESIHAALYAHTGTRRRADDQTLVVIRKAPTE